MLGMILTAVSVLIIVSSCKKEAPFNEPQYLFMKWTRAIKDLNYSKFRECEAHPKREGVFRAIYRTTYYGDCNVMEMGEFDKNDVKKDFDGNSYLSRKIWFECKEINRKKRMPIRTVRGDVDCINFIDGKRKDDGWLMWNRNIIRVDQ